MLEKIKNIVNFKHSDTKDTTYSDIDNIGYTEADKIIRDNCCKKAQCEVKKIAFLVFDLSGYKRFDNIFQHLQNDIFDIVYNCTNADEIKKIAAKNSYSCRSLASVLATNETYSIAVSNLMWFAWHISKFLPNLIAKKHIRVIYSYGFSAEVLGRNHNYIYNKILCYGPYQKEILESQTDASVISVGNPVLDPYFWEVFDTGSMKNKICESKKTIAWLTTVSEASSLREFLPIMEALSTRYNVFVNPHVLTSREDLCLLENSKLKGQVIFGDNLKLLSKSDFVICDYGGACFRALYLGKNILFFNPTNAERCSILNKDSPEFLLRTKIKSFDNTQIQEVIATLEDENYWKKQQDIRKQCFEKFFVDERGTSSYRVADILKCDLLKNG